LLLPCSTLPSGTVYAQTKTKVMVMEIRSEIDPRMKLTSSWRSARRKDQGRLLSWIWTRMDVLTDAKENRDLIMGFKSRFGYSLIPMLLLPGGLSRSPVTVFTWPRSKHWRGHGRRRGRRTSRTGQVSVLHAFDHAVNSRRKRTANPPGLPKEWWTIKNCYR